MSDLNRPDGHSGPADLDSTEERLRRRHNVDGEATGPDEGDGLHEPGRTGGDDSVDVPSAPD